ncbi:tail assembly protein [Acinetobacter bereziniae]|uniref:tail assembly protein n=1 Tax=Acinetobacter bereziniae TaxID=106648 RepID=UPI0018FFB5FD|nr:tail assembly protein [Acinetobacter bereziniae]MBJ8450345.1 tail assembly protein [Acinetobacter bereziniae]MBJ8454620.1 tail assembly protein [Acinetobacter bereziniae]
MYKTIRFHGVLRERFGKEWRLEVSSVKEAMRLLAVQIQGLEHFMLNAHKQGLRFAVFTDKRKTISEKEVDMQTGSELIRIMPIIEGAGGDSGLINTLLGAVMVVVGVVMMYFPGTQAMAPSVIGAGIGLLVGGIASMLMPKTQTDDANSDGNRANKGFGGAVTTVGQGNPVPILYGQREIGGFIISAGQYPEDQI